jgi:hypothetical protein
MSTHTHWTPELIERMFLPPYPEAPVCDLPTKKACEARYRAWIIETFGEKKTVSRDERAKRGAVKGSEPEYAPAVED